MIIGLTFVAVGICLELLAARNIGVGGQGLVFLLVGATLTSTTA